MTDLWKGLNQRDSEMDETASRIDEWLQISRWGLADVAAAEREGSRCSECKKELVELVGHDLICLSCGTIIDTPLDQGAEYRWFSSDTGTADPSRCGFPVNPLFPESSFGTIILNKSSKSKKMRTIMQIHTWGVMPSRERTLWKLFECFQIKMSNVGISQAVQEESKLLFAQFTASSSCRGENQRNALFAACVWEAFKRHDTPRLQHNIAELFEVPLKQMIIGIRSLQQTIATRASEENTSTYTSKKSRNDKTHNGTTGASLSETAAHRKMLGQKSLIHSISYKSYVETFMINLVIPRASYLQEITIEMCERIIKLGIIPENTPLSLAAATLIFCAKNLETPIELNVTDVSNACHVSCVTLQKSVKRLTQMKEKLLN